MERKEISYTAFVLTIMIFFISCNSEKIDLVKIDNQTNHVITLKKSYKIANTPEFFGAERMISNDNKNFYFSNGFTKKIYHTQRPFIKMETIGSTGEGPCEYSTPKNIKLFNEGIYFSDINNSLIKNYPLNGKLLADSCYSFIAHHGGQKFALNSRFICILNGKTPAVDIFLRETKEKIKSLINISSDYNFPNSRFLGGGIELDNDDNLYVTMVAPLKVWKISLKDDNPVLKNEWVFKNLSGVDSLQIKKLFVNKKLRENFTNLLKIPLTTDMFLFGTKKQNIIVHQSMRSGEFKDYYYIISNTGKLLNTLVSNKLALISAIDNNLFFKVQSTSSSDTSSTINEYEYNVNKKND